VRELTQQVSSTILDALRTSQDLGFLGPRAVEEQFHHALGFAQIIEAIEGQEFGATRPVRTGVDLGTGGGLPGLVVAAVFPEMQWVLLDAMERRMRVLREITASEPWKHNCTCVTSRAETWAAATGRDTADVVVSRSFGPPALVAECAAPMLRVGGWLIVSEPPEDPSLRRWAGLAASGLGFGTPRFVSRNAGFMVVDRVAAINRKLPRNPNAMAKKPLFT
jgi:16S rRNA (guanine527-N7)-methyltransferase